LGEEGLRVPTRRRKRQRLGVSTTRADRLAAEHPNHVWAVDYQFDQAQDGRILKLLTVVDEHTREALASGLVDHLGQGRADEVGDSTALRLEQAATGFTTWVPGCDAGVHAWLFVALETPSASRGGARRRG
jgi:hypothetical protein